MVPSAEVLEDPERELRALWDKTRDEAVPLCETSLVWRDPASSPTLARFIEFAKAQSSPC